MLPSWLSQKGDVERMSNVTLFLATMVSQTTIPIKALDSMMFYDVLHCASLCITFSNYICQIIGFLQTTLPICGHCQVWSHHVTSKFSPSQLATGYESFAALVHHIHGHEVVCQIYFIKPLACHPQPGSGPAGVHVALHQFTVRTHKKICSLRGHCGTWLCASSCAQNFLKEREGRLQTACLLALRQNAANGCCAQRFWLAARLTLTSPLRFPVALPVLMGPRREIPQWSAQAIARSSKDLHVLASRQEAQRITTSAAPNKYLRLPNYIYIYMYIYAHILLSAPSNTIHINSSYMYILSAQDLMRFAQICWYGTRYSSGPEWHALALNDKHLIGLYHSATRDQDTNQVSIQVRDLPVKAQKSF